MSRLRAVRLSCALVAGVGLWVLIVGLVVGEGWLRVPGLAAFLVFFAMTLGIDRLIARQPDPQVEGESMPDFGFDTITVTWPERIDDRRTA